jgi:hypothetical protein
LKSLAGLGELTSLNLNTTRVSDAGLENLAKLSKLKDLSVSFTKVTADGATKLQQALPKVKVTR